MGFRYQILLVDDNQDSGFIEPLADRAANCIDANLMHVPTWEEAKRRILDDPFEFQGLILDGKGQQSPVSKTEDNGFLYVAVSWLRDQSKAGFHLPYVVYSGYADFIKDIYGNEPPVFWKGRSEEGAMFTKLKELISDSDVYKCRIAHPDIFEIFDLGILNRKYVPDMCNVSEVLTGIFTGNKAALLRGIRPMIEGTLNGLNIIDDTLISPKYFRRKDPNVKGIIRYLSGSAKYNDYTDELEYESDVVIPEHISSIVMSLHAVTSNAIMHDDDAKVSGNLFHYCVYGFVEYLHWVKEFVRKNYSK